METVKTDHATSGASRKGPQPHGKGIRLVTDVYGDGQKPWYVILEYDCALSPEAVSAADYEVKDHKVEAVYTNTEPKIPEKSVEGCFVLVVLLTDDTPPNYGGGPGPEGAMHRGGHGPEGGMHRGDGPAAGGGMHRGGPGPEGAMQRGGGPGPGGGMYRDGGPGGEMHKGGGPGGRRRMSGPAGGSNRLSVTIQQIAEISFSDGTAAPAWSDPFSTDPSDNVNLFVENFSLDTFPLSNGSEMMYALYLPDDYDKNGKYPLVLFMPDATGEGDDPYLALTESLGGVIWTKKEWQSEHETIVLVPQYVWENSRDPALTMELVEFIAEEYAVDRSREYLVGQSSGTIRSIKLMIDNLDEFAAGLLIAGQTDRDYTDRMAGLASQHIWLICSEGDVRACPGMQEITDAVKAAGTPVTVAQWSAKLPRNEQEALAAEQADAGTAINWTIFDRGTVMRDDVPSFPPTEHMNTWRVTYDLSAVREWLFEQKK